MIERALTRDELRLWLDRPSPEQLELLPHSETRRHLHLLEGGVPLDERDWEEFELERVAVEKGAPFDELLPAVIW